MEPYKIGNLENLGNESIVFEEKSGLGRKVLNVVLGLSILLNFFLIGYRCSEKYNSPPRKHLENHQIPSLYNVQPIKKI